MERPGPEGSSDQTFGHFFPRPHLRSTAHETAFPPSDKPTDAQWRNDAQRQSGQCQLRQLGLVYLQLSSESTSIQQASRRPSGGDQEQGIEDISSPRSETGLGWFIYEVRRVIWVYLWCGHTQPRMTRFKRTRTRTGRLKQANNFTREHDRSPQCRNICPT